MTIIWKDLSEREQVNILEDPGDKLVGADMREAILWWPNFREVNLRGVDFSDANISNADLRMADLTGANLTKAYAAHTIFDGATCVHTVFENTYLIGATFIGATCVRSHFLCKYFDNVCFDCARISRCFFWGIDSDFLKIRRAIIHRTTMESKLIGHGDFSGSTFSGFDVNEYLAREKKMDKVNKVPEKVFDSEDWTMLGAKGLEGVGK